MFEELAYFVCIRAPYTVVVCEEDSASLELDLGDIAARDCGEDETRHDAPDSDPDVVSVER